VPGKPNEHRAEAAVVPIQVIHDIYDFFLELFRPGVGRWLGEVVELFEAVKAFT